jgi:hypothetical protein
MFCPTCKTDVEAPDTAPGAEVTCGICGGRLEAAAPAAGPALPPAADAAQVARPAGIPCPRCGHNLGARADLMGKKVECPACGARLSITPGGGRKTALAAAAAAPARPTPAAGPVGAAPPARQAPKARWTFLAASVIVAAAAAGAVYLGRGPEPPRGAGESPRPAPPGQGQLSADSTPSDGSGRPAAEGRKPEEAQPTGIELVAPEGNPPPPSWWSVIEAAGGARKVTVDGGWKFTPVPPGKYDVEVSADGGTGSAKGVVVKRGAVTRVTTADVGVGRLEVELPAARGVRLALGGDTLTLEVVRGGKARPVLLVHGAAAQSAPTGWLPQGAAVVRLKSGGVALEVPAQVTAGQTRRVPFDAAALAAKYRLSLARVTIRDPQGKEATRDTGVVLESAQDLRPLAQVNDPPPGTTWLAPAGLIVRARWRDQERVRSDVPVGTPAEVVVDFAAPPAGAQAQAEATARKFLSIKIEAPPSGTVVRGDEVTVVGRAGPSVVGGAVRLALVIDISGSTQSPSGADLNGDGKIDASDSILRAEVMAARAILKELQRAEARATNSPFEVTVVRFSSDAEVLVPLTRLNDAEGVARLGKALDEVERKGPGGGTNYVAALDRTAEALRASQHPGASIILMMTDGEPDAIPQSLAAAARAGKAGVIIHTLGLGKDFQDPVAPGGNAAVPRAVDTLKKVAAAGALGGVMVPLPRPAEVVNIVPQLIRELVHARVKKVEVVNATTGQPARRVQLNLDGTFRAEVPVSLVPAGKHEANTLVATAVAADGVSRASDRVQVLNPLATLGVAYPGKDLPATLRPSVELILDCSSSMGGLVDNNLPPAYGLGGRKVPKYLIAQKVLTKLVRDLPENVQVGLRLYGHRRLPTLAQRVRDSELVVPIAPLTAQQREWLTARLEKVQPRALTPLVYSLVEAKKDFRPGKGIKSVVLISDGGENCGGTLEQVRSAYGGSGIDLLVHVVGFDVHNDKEQQQLQALALIGGGKYFSANNAKDLADALGQAVPDGYEVFDEQGKVRRGSINGLPLRLEPGAYQARLSGSRAEPVKVKLAAGQRLVLRVNDAGVLVVHRTAPADQKSSP